MSSGAVHSAVWDRSVRPTVIEVTVVSRGARWQSCNAKGARRRGPRCYVAKLLSRRSLEQREVCPLLLRADSNILAAADSRSAVKETSESPTGPDPANDVQNLHGRYPLMPCCVTCHADSDGVGGRAKVRKYTRDRVARTVSVTLFRHSGSVGGEDGMNRRLSASAMLFAAPGTCSPARGSNARVATRSAISREITPHP